MTQLENYDLQRSNEFTSESDLYKFSDKLDNESYKRLIERRDNLHLKMAFKDRSTSCQTLWDKKPVDFSRKLFNPNPPKRNTRESMKPWDYDKYLRTSQDESIFWEKEEPKVTVKDRIIANAFSESFDNWAKDFETEFKIDSSSDARKNAARLMGFRDGLDQFKNPKDHDFRGLKHLGDNPEFKAKMDKDPQKIKFITQNLDQIHGLSDGTVLRDIQHDQQMGDLVKKKDLRYDPKLILPRLQFPNKYSAYTRHKTNNNNADDIYWEKLMSSLRKAAPEAK